MIYFGNIVKVGFFPRPPGAGSWTALHLHASVGICRANPTPVLSTWEEVSWRKRRARRAAGRVILAITNFLHAGEAVGDPLIYLQLKPPPPARGRAVLAAAEQG